MIKVISLWQPHASLVAASEKRWETRPQTISWRNYRGEVAIHATKTQPAAVERLCYERPFSTVMLRHGLLWSTMPRGAILCVTAILDVVPVEEVRDQLSAQERAFGNYADGRLAIRLGPVRVLSQPIPVAGHQGMWTYEGEL